MTTITTYGAVYLRQPSGDIEYSIDNRGTWTAITSYPVTIVNEDANIESMLVVYFDTDLEFSSNDQYFICGSNYIQFGSKTLRPDGTCPTITMKNVTDYPGLVENGTSGANGKQVIYVFNLKIIGTGTNSLNVTTGAGWFGAAYFGKKSDENVIINCTSTLPIGQNCGGIIGSNAAREGQIIIRGCASTGAIGLAGGGIIGASAGLKGTVSLSKVDIIDCYSTGSIGFMAGGIAGQSFGGSESFATISRCFSTGSIGQQAGGITGDSPASNSGSVGIITCYSHGNIGTDAGGIVGSNSGGSTGTGIVSIQKSYSLGTINPTGGGGIVGKTYARTTVVNSYTAGTGTTGGIYSGSSSDNPVGFNNYSNANNGTTGWSVVRATSSMGTVYGVSAWVPNVNNGGIFEIFPFRYSPYVLENITGTNKGTLSLANVVSETVKSGGTTTLPGYGSNFELVETSLATINSTTGIISSNTLPPGTYTLRIKTTSYSVTAFVLTVEEAPSPSAPIPTKKGLVVDMSQYIAMKRANANSQGKNGLDPTKFRAPSLYSVYNPFYKTNIEGNGVTSPRS